MSLKNVERPFWTDDKTMANGFTGIRELGFDDRGGFVVYAWTTPAVPPGEPRGTYFTTIPISPAEYRRRHHSQAAFVRMGDRLILYDDWGRPHAIFADDAILDVLVSECRANEIADLAPPDPVGQEREGTR